MSEKDLFLTTLDKEVQTTLKVLKAFPPAKADFKPHAKSKTAKDLAWIFVTELAGSRMAIDGAMEFAKLPKPPATFADVIPALEQTYKALVDHVKRTPDAEFNKTVKFFTGPKQMGDMRRMDVLWFLLTDGVHHRGQFSIYLRMVDGKVPSIYGPSADEPWN